MRIVSRKAFLCVCVCVCVCLTLYQRCRLTIPTALIIIISILIIIIFKYEYCLKRLAFLLRANGNRRMSRTPPHLEAAAFTSPLTPSQHTSSLSAASVASLSPSPGSFSPARDLRCSFTVSNTTSATTGTTLPPPPPGDGANLTLRHHSSLHTLFSTSKPPILFGTRPPTDSEAASEFVSRGSYVKREEETKVDELLFETTQVFHPPLPTAETAVTEAPSPTVSAAIATQNEGESRERQQLRRDEEDSDPPAAADTTMNSCKLDSRCLSISSRNQRMSPQRLARPSFQLATSTRTRASESVETVESYDPQLRKIVSVDLTSSSSLRSLSAASPLRQPLTSTMLYPVSPPYNSTSSSRRPLPMWPPSGSPVDDREAPQQLMRFPVFSGLADALRSQNSCSIHNEASFHSNTKSRNGTEMPRETTVATPPAVAPPGGRLSAGDTRATTPNTTTVTTDSFSRRERTEAPESVLANSPSHLSEGISGTFTSLSPCASFNATTAAILSSEEVVVPSRSLSRLLAEPREASSRHSSATMRRRPGMVSSVSEIVTSPSFQPLSVNAAGSTLTQSLPTIQLCPKVPYHLYRVSQDGCSSLEPLLGSDGRQESLASTIAPADLSRTTVNLPVQAECSKPHCRRLAASLPQLSPLPSANTSVVTTNAASARAASAVRAGESSVSGPRSNGVPPFILVDSTERRTPLLDRLFRESKLHRSRMWVNTRSDNLSSLPPIEKRHGSCN